MSTKGKRNADPGENLALWKKAVRDNWYELEVLMREKGNTTQELEAVEVTGLWNWCTSRWNHPRVMLVYDKTDRSECLVMCDYFRVHWMLSRWEFHDAGPIHFKVTRAEALSGV